MYFVNTDVAVIGGGPAGLAAALAARTEGARALVLERDGAPGGILQQCIHPGFGLKRFGEELTGPEYAGRYEAQAREAGVEFLFNAMVLEIDGDKREILCVGSEHGMIRVQTKSVVLAMGCREKTRAGIMVPGARPAGIYTAGAAQRLLNRQNVMVGKTVVILGSGDIGMIMARRMTLEGARVVMVVELMDYLAGLTRNRVQCLEDFGIALRLAHTVTRIEGVGRVTGVYVAPVDERRNPIREREEFVPCDTVLFSVGLIPENELTRKAGIQMDPITGGPVVNQFMQTSQRAVFACGNVVHVNDLVDNVSEESARAGRNAARCAMGRLTPGQKACDCAAGRNVRYVCPQRICVPACGEVSLYFRALRPETGVRVVARCGKKELAFKKEFQVNPGEMNAISIRAAEIEGETLTIDVMKEA